MNNPYFRFRNFALRHDRCAMRVGTDGVLLGAWAEVLDARRILDIGTGCGLIALMAAQRNPEALVWGIDIDADSVLQADQNVQASPYAERVKIIQCDVRLFDAPEPFDAVLCNPPFHPEHILPPDQARCAARNTSSLGFGELVRRVDLLLSETGLFSVVLPMSVRSEFVSLCLLHQLYLCRQCEVSTVLGRPPKRIMLTFTKSSSQPFVSETLTLQDASGHRTLQYASLTEAFYLPDK
jgi:tRNA1Val (adenine37-N6)-methyltransferase